MKNMSRKVDLYCPTCGGKDFEIVDKINCPLMEAPDNTKIKCVNCNTDYTKLEIIEGNQNIINSNVEAIKEEAIKEILKTFKDIKL